LRILNVGFKDISFRQEDFMTILEHLNKVIAYIPLVDSQDLSALPAIINELEQIMLEGSTPEAVLIQVTRCCKLAEHITLNETDFENGIHKLSQNISRLISNLEINGPSETSMTCSIDSDNTGFTSQSDIQSDEMSQFRSRFASTQKSVLEDFESYIFAFEKNDQMSVQELKRVLHTWKGEFGVLELPQYSSLIHKIEEAIEEKCINPDQLFYFKDFLNSQLPLIASGQIPEVLLIDYEKLFPQDFKPSPVKTPAVHSKPTCLPHDSIYEPHVPPFADIDRSLLSDFVMESRDHIHTAETLLLTLDSDPTNTENLNSIFRSCHTIKGVAGFINLQDLGTLSHTLEGVLDKSRRSELVLTSSHIDLLLRSMDCLKELIKIIENCLGGEVYLLPVSFQDVMINLKNVINDQFTSSPPLAESPKTQESSLPDIQGSVSTMLGMENPSDASISPDVSVIIAPVEMVQKVSDNAPVNGQAKSPTNLEETIRVPVQRLDQLIDAIGEAVIAQSMISADPTIRSSTNQTLHTKIAQTTMIMRQLQELSMSLRMVSIRSTFQKMARLVRDLSKKSEKEVHFVTEGEDTEIDKSVVENIGDPLIHMIRNSVDHGLESPEERLAKGKEVFGTVLLKAYHKAGSVYIEIKDDGKGLDKELIFNKAVQKGLCKADDTLSEAEIFHFIFLPGFSTAKTVTDISGRGVGMDVVKRNIESLRGSVEIISEKDKGTLFTIRLPLTLAIIDGMIIRVEQSTYIVPTLSIIETIATSSDQFVNVLNKGELIKIRDSLVPVIHVSKIFGNLESSINGKPKIALIVEDMMRRRTGLVVDEIIGQQQVVIKNLGNGLGDVPGISGGAIMSDGTVSLIIDVGGIVKTAYN
jgi:two-component system chemotaxis sensor kinase CheA